MAEYIDKQKAIDAVKRWDQQKLYLPIEFLEMLEVIQPAEVRAVDREDECKQEETWDSLK